MRASSGARAEAARDPRVPACAVRAKRWLPLARGRVRVRRRTMEIPRWNSRCWVEAMRSFINARLAFVASLLAVAACSDGSDIEKDPDLKGRIEEGFTSDCDIIGIGNAVKYIAPDTKLDHLELRTEERSASGWKADTLTSTGVPRQPRRGVRRGLIVAAHDCSPDGERVTLRKTVRVGRTDRSASSRAWRSSAHAWKASVSRWSWGARAAARRREAAGSPTEALRVRYDAVWPRWGGSGGKWGGTCIMQRSSPTARWAAPTTCGTPRARVRRRARARGMARARSRRPRASRR